MKKYAVKIYGQPTSISLEPEFWRALHDIAAREKRTLTAVLNHIDKTRTGSLSGAIRLYVLAFLQAHQKDNSAE